MRDAPAEQQDWPYTIVITFDEIGPLIDGVPARGFAATTTIILSAPYLASVSGDIDLAWVGERLPSGIFVEEFLQAFWANTGIAHSDGLAFGRLLLGRLLDDARGALRARWAKFQDQRRARPLRIELVLPAEADSPIGAIPFELLADDNSFLFYAGRGALVRRFRDQPPRVATVQPRDRLLIAWANPTGLDPRLEDAVFEKHGQTITTAGCSAGLDVAPVLARAGRVTLQDALRAHAPVNLVSLMAHGYASGGMVALEHPDRTPDPTAAESIAGSLRSASAQVALLWSCYGAAYHATRGSLVAHLLDPDRGNLAAVVAAHGALEAAWTVRATQRLFEALLAPPPNDFEQAVTDARQSLDVQRLQWAALAYYARPADGPSVTSEVYPRAAQAAVAAIIAPAIVGVRAGGEVVTRLPGNARPAIEDLPDRPTHWIDRPAEAQQVVELIQSARLVTVRGMPGIGKTEVTCEAARQLLSGDAFASGLWVRLDMLRSVDHLRARIADWAGLQDVDAPDWKLTKRIGARSALWILDNAEDLIRTAGDQLRQFLTTLLEACPGIRVLLTSQRALGNLRSQEEQTLVVRRIENQEASHRLFAAAAGGALRAHPDALRDIVALLDGHPRSLVLVASQVRNHGANLPSILTELRQHGDQAVLSAALLDSDIDWTKTDRQRAEHLVASLHLAYTRLRSSAGRPNAAELFAWLGILPAGLPVALAPAIFGHDASECVAALRRVSLVELRGADERLDLPAPIRWYAARQLAADVASDRQADLLARTLDIIGELWAEAYARIGQPGAGFVLEANRRDALNLVSLLEQVERHHRDSSQLATLVVRATWRWSMVRIFAGRSDDQLALVERARQLGRSAAAAPFDLASLGASLGDLYVRTNRLADAEREYLAALNAFSTLEAPLGQANTRKAVGDLYLRTHRVADAEREYLVALDEFSAIDNRLGLANTRRALGDLYLRTDRPTDAERAYLAALNAFSAIGNHLGLASARQALGDLYLRTNRLADAEREYLTARNTFSAIDEHLGLANTRQSLGDLYLRTNRLADAEREYLAALDGFSAIDASLGQANTWVALGDLYVRTDRPADAAREYLAALDTFSAIDNHLGLANTRLARGSLYLRTHRLAEAEREYLVALDVFSAIDEHLGQANTRKALGDLYVRTHRLADAEHAYTAALDTFSAIDNRRGNATTRMALGELYVRTHRLTDAERAYLVALEALSALDDYLGHANTQQALGELYLRTNRLTEAEHALLATLNTFSTIDDRLGQANTRIALGELYLRTNRFTEAEREYLTALDTFSVIKERLGYANALSGLGQLAAARGQYDEALLYLRRAHDEHRAIDNAIGVAAQFGYMARVAASAGRTDRAIALSARARRALRAIGDSYGAVLAGCSLLESAKCLEDASLYGPALLLTWHEAKTTGDPRANMLGELIRTALSPSMINRDLTPEQLADLEAQLTTAIEAVEQRLAATDEDPLASFPPSPSHPP